MLSFVLKHLVKKVTPLGGGMELCGSSSCLEDLRSLLNTEGILTLPMFMLSVEFLLHLIFQHKRQLTLHTFLISIYNRSVIPIFTPFKLQDNSTFKETHRKTVFTHHKIIFSRKYLSFKFSDLLLNSSNKAEEGTC